MEKTGLKIHLVTLIIMRSNNITVTYCEFGNIILIAWRNSFTSDKSFSFTIRDGGDHLAIGIMDGDQEFFFGRVHCYECAILCLSKEVID